DLTEPRFNAGHLAISAAGDVAVVSAPRDGLPNPSQQLGAVTLVPKGKPPHTVTRPSSVVSRMLGETLSVAIHDGVVVATHPEGDMVSMWQMDGALLGKLDELPEPRGVTLTLDEQYFVLSHRTGRNVGITLVPTATRVPQAEGRVDPSFTSGSHLFTHDLAPR